MCSRADPSTRLSVNAHYLPSKRDPDPGPPNRPLLSSTHGGNTPLPRLSHPHLPGPIHLDCPNSAGEFATRCGQAARAARTDAAPAHPRHAGWPASLPSLLDTRPTSQPVLWSPGTPCGLSVALVVIGMGRNPTRYRALLPTAPHGGQALPSSTSALDPAPKRKATRIACNECHEKKRKVRESHFVTRLVAI